jgi:hypothetical protein
VGRRRRGGEAELREERPDAAPAAGEDAGPARGGGGAEAEEDEDQDVVGEQAETVLAGGCVGFGGGGIHALRGDRRRVLHAWRWI